MVAYYRVFACGGGENLWFEFVLGFVGWCAFILALALAAVFGVEPWDLTRPPQDMPNARRSASVSSSTPPGTRTLNPLIKSQLLCQLS